MGKNSNSYKIGLYVRVSTEDQAANPEGSLKSQEQRLRDHVAYRNQESDFGKITRIFIDRAKSGGNMNRPELQNLLKAVREKEVDLILVTEVSRLSRSLLDFCGIWDLMHKNGCSFQSLREQFDTTTAAGEMVLFNMVNFAQFERRQIGERVTANFLARSQRGLYNGGSVPLGYKLSEKKGYLLVDDEAAEVVRAAFKIFLEEGSLQGAGKVLNERGYKLKKKMQGSGPMSRLGYFTADNLYTILINKMYLGLKPYKIRGQEKLAKAVWEPIVDAVTFQRVNEILKKNYRCLKPPRVKKYQYLLSGFLHCDCCKKRLAGKSANGNGGMIPYYEHAWQTKKQAYLKEKKYECMPNRVLSKVIDQRVWEEVVNVLTQPSLSKSLVVESQEFHSKHSHLPEKDKIRTKIGGVEKQLEALAEHLTNIPKNVSPQYVFGQMEKLEKIKQDLELQVRRLDKANGTGEVPVGIKTYQAFLETLNLRLRNHDDSVFRRKVVERLIQKIDLLPNGFNIHWIMGESRFIELPPAENKNGSGLLAAPGIFLSGGSFSLDIGWGGRIRTSE